MKREADRRISDVTQDRMLNVTESKRGVSHDFNQRCHNSISAISLILLGLLLVIGLARAEPRKSGRTRATPPKSGGSCGPDSGPVSHAPIRPHAGSLSSLLIPAGRLKTAPQRAAETTETGL